MGERPNPEVPVITGGDPSREIDRINLKHLEPLVSEMRAQFECANLEDRPAIARGLVHACMQVLHCYAGTEALNAAYGPDPSPDASYQEKLQVLAMRLWLVQDVFPMDNEQSESSIRAATREVHALANGDQPILFAGMPGVKGRDSNAYQLARHKLRALEWERFLRACGMRAGLAQSQVGIAYVEGWDTIRRWRKPIEKALGAEAVLRDLKNASRPGWLMAGYFRTEADALQALARDGRAYRAEYNRG